MAIFGVAALVIAAMWIFQVFLLQGIYLAGKKSQFIADTKTMVSTIEQMQEKDILATFSVVEVIEDLAVKNSYYLEVTDISGSPIISFNAMGERSALKNNSLVRTQVVYSLLSGSGAPTTFCFLKTPSPPPARATTSAVSGPRLASRIVWSSPRRRWLPWEKRWTPFAIS